MIKYKAPNNNYYFLKEGKGPPILFAHGLFINHTIFDKEIDVLKTNYTCYSFDLPGHGDSSYNRSGWALDDVAEDMKSFILENDLQRPVLIGHSSLGGMIFARLTARYPELIGKLVLIGASPWTENTEHTLMWNNTIRILEKGNHEKIIQEITQIQYNIVGADLLKRYSIEHRQQLDIMLSNQPEAMIVGIEAAALERGDISEELSKIICPTLIISGSEDYGTPSNIAKQMSLLIKNSQLEIIPDTGHYLPIEVPNKLNKFLTLFLA